MRRHKRFSQILGISVITSLIVIGVMVTHRLIKNEIAAQTSRPLCLRLEQSEAQCYSIEALFSKQATTALAGQPNGHLLVSSDRTSIHVWDLQTKQRLQTLNGHSTWVTALTISGNGSLLASADLDGNIKLWQLPSGQLLHTFKTNRITALAFNRTGTVLASASRLMPRPRLGNPLSTPSLTHYPIQLWNVATFRQIANLDATEPVNALVLSPDAQWLAAGMTSTKVWHLPSLQLIHTLNSGDLNALLFSPDSKLLLTGSDGVRGEDGIKMWQVESGRSVRVLDSVAADFALSEDGSLLITTYGATAHLWRMQPFGYLGGLRGSEYSGVFAEFGLKGNAIALGSSDGVKVWFAYPENKK